MIYLAKPYFDDNEINAIKETFNSGWVAGQGPKGEELSEHIKKITNTKFAIPVNNCTAGLHLSLLSIGIKPGDEVLVSDYTFPATGHSVMFCGAKARFIDVNLRTYIIEPSLIEEKINNKTKAIVVVHEFGQMADMDKILEISKRYNLKVIEDAACAMGAKQKGKPAGSFGDITAFSFHARKNTTSGEGGIVVTNNEDYADIISSLSCFGMESAFKRQKDFKIPSFNALGYNYKLSDINAAIALEQLKKYPIVLERKRRLVNLYNTLLENSKFITTPIEQKYNYHVYQT
ncbi:MAG: DegT/DnrJ/EryC1/StrS family aminotransferase, partial [Actinobacteria bacterium]|nr:DegT/DnrJ/EryC1/StrS family aminotransferase [Actinomycetota bacterium]